MVPVLERRVVHPPVGGAAVVGDNVHDDLDAFLMRFLHKQLIVLVVAETGVYVVVVGAGIAVVALGRLVVEEKRRAPDGRGAQVGHVVQVVYHALDVSSMAGHRVLAVYLVGRCGNAPGTCASVKVLPSLPGAVVVPEGRCEAVRHDEVDHIGLREAPAGGTSLLPFAYDVRILEGLTASGKDEVIRAGGRYLHVYKEVIRTVGPVHLRHLEPLSGDGHLIGRDAGALHHELEGCLHARPPAEGFHA